MSRLLVLVEGETEETFVNELLSRYLTSIGFADVSARLMGNQRQRRNRGGIRGWPEVLREIARHLKCDSQVYLTTMVDYYGMPRGENDRRAWPGRNAADLLPFAEKADSVQNGMAAAIRSEMDDSWNPRRFIPFVLMHEFEALLFSDCSCFAAGIGRPALAASFQSIRDSAASPEEINDSPTTHPSQRIRQLVPHYQKPLLGNLAALEIGIEAIRTACPHFRGWLERLSMLVNDVQT